MAKHSPAARSTCQVAAMSLLAKARGKAAGVDSPSELRVFGMQSESALEEHVLRLFVVRIGQAAFDRADRLTRFVIVEADALGAELRIDHVDRVTLRDGFVGTFGLAGAAVDAVFGDARG